MWWLYRRAALAAYRRTVSLPWPDAPPGFADAADLMFDSWVISHGQTEYVRDYDIVIALPAARPDGSGSYIEGHYRVRFSHSPIQQCETVLPDETWRASSEYGPVNAGAHQGRATG